MPGRLREICENLRSSLPRLPWSLDPCPEIRGPWSNNCYLGFQSAVLVAIRAPQFQAVTKGLFTVTAEAAGSSPVVPAIPFKHFQKFALGANANQQTVDS